MIEDRFARDGDRPAPDLPTGDAVTLAFAPAGDVGEHREPAPAPPLAALAEFSRAAGLPAVYGEHVGEGAGVIDGVDGRARLTGPRLFSGEVEPLRQKAEAANGLIERGRHAPGFRQLRQAIGALARRDAWSDATRGSLQLATGLLRRGRARDARAELVNAGDYAGRAGDAALVLEAAILTGEACVDLARLDDAERTLSAALTSARAAGDPARSRRAALALARCLFWRGRHADTDAILRSPSNHVDGPDEIERQQLLAENAIALRDVSTAMTAVGDARRRAAALDPADGWPRAEVEHTAAFVHLMAGDLDAVDRDISGVAAAARFWRHPQYAFSARLLQAEADRRRGRTPTRTALHLLRRMAAAMPPLLRARWELFMALASTAGRAEAVAERIASASGIPALGLLAGPVNARRESPIAATSPETFIDEVVAILHLCQTADDERAVLKAVCTRVRRHLDAAGVGFWATAGTGLDVMAFDGARTEPGIAERAVGAGLAITPHQCRGRIECASPVQYGGRIIGALTARWAPGPTQDLSRAAAVLSLAAAAAAPTVWAALVAAAPVDRQAGSRGVELLGGTPTMCELWRVVARAAAAPFPVLVEGESGVGKELVARALHQSGPRRDRPFLTLNCAALPDDLVEAELFGHMRGSFTGAAVDRAGIFEEAHGGTLLLDEVGELSPRAQAKLLRIIQEGELRRVGENAPRRVDVRIVSATNRDLGRDVDAGRFRRDLLYRLDVVRISVPPLRERGEDVTLLVDHYWTDMTRRVGSRAILAGATRTALASYHWPGNVRELQNVLASLAVRSPRRGVVPPTALPIQFAIRPRREEWRLGAARRTFEEGFVRAALVRSGGHRSRAARELGVTRQGLTKLMSRLGIYDDRRPPGGAAPQPRASG
jgi:DNA-binding NtrC family response regulator